MNKIVDKVRRLPQVLLAFAKNLRRWRNLGWMLVEYGIMLGVYQLAPGEWYSRFLIAALAAFLAFEFIAEPLGLSGHYWERGPREGEGDPPYSGWWSE